MATPKGTRAVKVSISATDSVHVYSDEHRIWLQLRRDYPTESKIEATSFKAAVIITAKQALAIAGELLTAASAENVAPNNSFVSEEHSAAASPKNHGKQWTPEEDRQLISRYDSKLKIEEIAKKHKRGIGGIQSRLTKLGKVVPENPTTE